MYNKPIGYCMKNIYMMIKYYDKGGCLVSSDRTLSHIVVNDKSLHNQSSFYPSGGIIWWISSALVGYKWVSKGG